MHAHHVIAAAIERHDSATADLADDLYATCDLPTCPVTGTRTRDRARARDAAPALHRAYLHGDA